MIALVAGAILVAVSIADRECPEAILYCSNGGSITTDNCTTRPYGPYERQRTTQCDCPDGYAGPDCGFVTDASICVSSNLTLQSLPGPIQSASMGCQIDSDMSSEILNLIDHYAYIDLDLDMGAMNVGIDSRVQYDGPTYSDVVEILYCSMSRCHSEFDNDGVLASMDCEVLPGDCVGAFQDELFMASLNGVAASFSQNEEGNALQVSVALESIYALPLNMQCMAGHCVDNGTDPLLIYDVSNYD